MANRQCKVLLFLIVLSIGLTVATACTPQKGADPEVLQLPEVPEGVFYVDPGTVIGKISPLVYGINHGPWAVITDKTMPLAQEAGISLLRFPGGNWGDENDLQHSQIDQFSALADQMGSQLFINVRLFKGTPEKAAELVYYANVENDFGVKYWGIGNEPSLYATSKGVTGYGVVRFNAEWREIAEAMKAVDPDILLIGPELHQFGSNLETTPKDPAGLDWMTEFLKSNGDLVDIVSIHRYPFPQSRGGRAATINELLVTSTEWDQIIPYLRNLILEITGRNIPIAITEVNSHWSNAVGGEATPDSYYNAVWWADALGRMIFNRVEIVNYFSLHSNPSIGGYGILSRSDARPTYFVYDLYQHFGETLVFSGCQDAQVGVYAALNSDKQLTILLINLSEEEIARPLLIEGKLRSLFEIWHIDEANMLYQLDPSQVNLAEDIILPRYSITLLIVK